jgi:hypothetical protein
MQNGDSSVDIVTGLWARRPRTRGSITDSNKSFIFQQSVQTGSRSQPATYRVCAGGISLGGKMAGRGVAYHSFHSSVDVKY